ncbi:mitochondrial fission regulator 1 [Chanodichthys erythropterus]|uniref:mitochondrial fission regulator 1 n=1 Tax=Chanodichthys erythropterus TaxID=933992 RepID=UPI00351E9EC5
MSRNHRRIEMDLALSSLSSKPYGSSRSIVRRIATSLPLAPCARVHFQLHPFTSGAGFLNNSNGPNGLVATLADVGWIEREESDGAGRNRSEANPGLFFRTQQRRPLRRQRSLPSLHQAEPAPQSQTIINDEAIQKISVLETELAKLRAQIAQIVQAQEQSAQSTAPAPGGPPVSQAPPMAPPPPPPPPPPCPAPGMQRSYSAIDLIRERRGKKTEQNTVLDSAPKKPELPNMLDVLKDMGKVKLRSVKSHQEDSHTKPKPVEPTDAAALIAEALKRKFAHRYRSDSECDSTFNLPAPENNKTHVETPLFGQHMLKSTGRKKLY